MKGLARGEIVTALFFKDKPRPGVVVRAGRYAESENVTLCPITSTLAGGPIRVQVMPGPSGLARASEIVPYRITTLPAHRVSEAIGQLSSAELRELDRVLRDWLDLNGRWAPARPGSHAQRGDPAD
jgi:mRNA-degrading endonuclease toxin of MazEF toxin-antitoxin module